MNGVILVVVRLLAFFVMRNIDGFNNKRGQLEKTVEQMQLGYFRSMQLVRLQMIENRGDSELWFINYVL